MSDVRLESTQLLLNNKLYCTLTSWQVSWIISHIPWFKVETPVSAVPLPEFDIVGVGGDLV